jgi:hypothetical protein
MLMAIFRDLLRKRRQEASHGAPVVFKKQARPLCPYLSHNYRIIESLQKFHHYYGDDFKVECPTGSGRFLTIGQVADEVSRRLIRVFLRDESGRRPVLAYHGKLHGDPHFRDYVLFHEYFHGDTGRGVGASH